VFLSKQRRSKARYEKGTESRPIWARGHLKQREVSLRELL